MSKGDYIPRIVKDWDVLGRLALHKTRLADVRISGCDDTALWTVTAGGATKALVAGIDGGNALQLTVPSTSYVRYTGPWPAGAPVLDLRGRSPYFAITCNDNTKITTVRYALYQGAKYAYYWGLIQPVMQDGMPLKDVNGNWQYVQIHHGNLTHVGGTVDFSQIDAIEIMVQPEAGQTPVVTVDAFGYTENYKPGFFSICHDDGYDSDYVYAFPRYAAKGWTGTFAITTGVIENGAYPGRLTWAQIQRMRDAGCKFISHSDTHPDLDTAAMDVLRYELAASRRRLANHGVLSESGMLAWPAGKWDMAALAEAKKQYRHTLMANQTFGINAPSPYQTCLYRNYGPQADPATAAAWIDAVKEHGGFLILYFHGLGTSPDWGAGYDLTKHQTIIDYAAASGLEHVNLDEAAQRMENLTPATPETDEHTIIRKISTDITLLPTDANGVILVDTSAASRTETMPLAAETNGILGVRNTGRYGLTLTRQGSDTFEDAGVSVFVPPYTTVQFAGDHLLTWYQLGFNAEMLARLLSEKKCANVPLSGWVQTLVGSGSAALSHTYQKIATGTTANSSVKEATGISGFGLNMGAWNWDKRVRFPMTISRSLAAGEADARWQIKAANAIGALGAVGLGWRVTNGVLYLESYGTQLGEVNCGALADDTATPLLIDFVPGVRADAYLNGVLVGSQTTVAALPTGVVGAPLALHTVNNGPSGGVQVQSQISQFWIIQDK